MNAKWVLKPRSDGVVLRSLHLRHQDPGRSASASWAVLLTDNISLQVAGCMKIPVILGLYWVILGLYWGNIGVILGYIGIMENTMETTSCLGCKENSVVSFLLP